jgi:hypothetical protein
MIRLKELLHSLTVAIISYHDLTVTHKPYCANEELRMHYARNLLYPIKVGSFESIDEQGNDDSEIRLAHSPRPRLEKIIQDTVNQSSDTKGPLYYYLVNEIEYIKSQVERTTPFSPQELAYFQQQLTQLFKNIQGFINEPQKTAIQARYSAHTEDARTSPITIMGCNSTISAMALQIVFRMSRIPLDTDGSAIEEFIRDACNELQSPLLVEALQAQLLSLPIAEPKQATPHEPICASEQSALANENRRLVAETSRLSTLLSEQSAAADENRRLAAEVSQLKASLKVVRSMLAEQPQPRKFGFTSFFGCLDGRTAPSSSHDASLPSTKGL